MKDTAKQYTDYNDVLKQCTARLLPASSAHMYFMLSRDLYTGFLIFRLIFLLLILGRPVMWRNSEVLLR